MTLYEARNILGPIRTYWDRTLDCWCMDGAPATHKEICREAQRIWDGTTERQRYMILMTPIRA